MADQYDFDVEVAPVDRLDLLRERLRARGRHGWHLVAVLPYARGDPGDLLLVWERTHAHAQHQHQTRDDEGSG